MTKVTANVGLVRPEGGEWSRPDGQRRPRVEARGAKSPRLGMTRTLNRKPRVSRGGPAPHHSRSSSPSAPPAASFVVACELAFAFAASPSSQQPRQSSRLRHRLPHRVAVLPASRQRPRYGSGWGRHPGPWWVNRPRPGGRRGCSSGALGCQAAMRLSLLRACFVSERWNAASCVRAGGGVMELTDGSKSC